MIHTFTVSYELSLKDANTCTYRLQERTQAFKDKKYRITNFLDVNRKFGRLIFKVPEFPGIDNIVLLKFTDRNEQRIFRIYFQIEAEILRTGRYTLDLFFCSPEHAQELQIQYAKVIYSLFPEAFTGRPASHLATSDFADITSYTPEEYINGEKNNGHGGLYSLPYLPLGSVSRIDFTYDHVAADEKQAEVYTEMLGKSYYDGWKKKVHIGQNKNKEKGSEAKSHDRAFASGRKTFSGYYKYDKMMSEKYDDRSNIAQIREDSRNVVRIEMPIKNPDRKTIKSLTWLQIPNGAITLGALPYLATEQVSMYMFGLNFIGRVGNFYELKWYTRKGLDKRVKRLIQENKISNHKGQTITKLTASISKRGSLTNYIRALKKYQATKNKTKPKEKKQFLTMEAFNGYKNLAMQNGMMLATIPAKRGVEELSAYPNLRNYDSSMVTSQIITHMLPYRSITETVPEMEPVKDLYDSILGFLYGLYDQYSEPWNRKIEEVRLSPEEAGLIGA